MSAARRYRVAPFEEDLCLSFANTRYWRGRDAPVETLGDVAALREWCVRQGGVEEALVAATLRSGGEQAMLFSALDARELVWRLFAAVAGGREPDSTDARLLAALLAAAPARDRVDCKPSEAGWRVAGTGGIATLLAPVIWSAADLLARTAMRRVRCCGNPQCLWLFLDRSKSGTRRWCDMTACGNRAKAARHYERTRRGRE